MLPLYNLIPTFMLPLYNLIQAFMLPMYNLNKPLCYHCSIWSKPLCYHCTIWPKPLCYHCIIWSKPFFPIPSFFARASSILMHILPTQRQGMHKNKSILLWCQLYLFVVVVKFYLVFMVCRYVQYLVNLLLNYDNIKSGKLFLSSNKNQISQIGRCSLLNYVSSEILIASLDCV